MKITEATRPDIFDAIWKQVWVHPADVLVDIGCGDGDAIQYWLDMGLENFIVGVEINRAVYLKALDRFKRQPQVLIIYGDATVYPPKGTLYYVFNPFGGEKMMAFEYAMRQIKTPVRIVYNATQIKELAMFGPTHWDVREIVAKPNYMFRAAMITRKP